MSAAQGDLVHPRRVPKLVGADTEFANFIDGPTRLGGTANAAVNLLLREVDGPPHGASYQSAPAVWSSWYVNGVPWVAVGDAGGEPYNPQDIGRRYQLSNGGCVYEDLTHYEACIPEVLSASDFTAAVHASFIAARQAAVAATAKLPADQRVVVLANNTDGVVSWGSHFNIALSRAAFGSIVNKLYPNAFFLGAYQASSQLFTGQGRVGAANGRPWCDFQISQRADFVETFFSSSTTHNRPLVNARDEAHCGPDPEVLARLHMISFDHTLQHVATYLKCGATQLVLAMIEAGWVDRNTILVDPVEAMWAWSRDPRLEATALMADGREVTMVDHQVLVAQRAARFVEEGEAEGYVPEAEKIVALWEETLAMAEQRDFAALAGRLDWALKLAVLESALEQNADLAWRSAQIHHLDMRYASVLDDGLYFTCEPTLDRLLTPGQVERFLHEPPEDTRAWTRAKVLRRAAQENVVIEHVDWDSITFKTGHGWEGDRYTLDMSNPFGHTRDLTEEHFQSATSFIDLMNRLQTAAALPTSEHGAGTTRVIGE